MVELRKGKVTVAEPNNDDDLKKVKGNEKTPTAVYIVFISLLLDLLSFTMILPLFPSLLEYYKQSDEGGLYTSLSSSISSFQETMGIPDRYNSVLFGGFLGSMFSFLQFLASPIVGGLSDVYGRKPILVLCMTGVICSYLLWAYSVNFGLFVLARFVGGLSKGNISLSMAIITDNTNQNNRGKGMALVGIAFSLGFIFGPMIGAIFSKLSDKTSEHWFWLPAIFATTLAIADLLFVLTFLKESLPQERRSKRLFSSLSQAFEYISVRALFSFSAVKGLNKKDLASLQKLSFIYFVYLFIYSGLEFTVTFLMYHKFDYNSIDQAKMFLTTGLIMTILQGGVVRRLPPKYIQGSAVFGLYLIIPSFIVIGLAKSSVMLYIGMSLFAICK